MHCASARVVNFAIGPSFGYFKGNVDYFPYGAFMIGSDVDEDTTEPVADSVKNFSAGVSAGVVLFF